MSVQRVVGSCPDKVTATTNYLYFGPGDEILHSKATFVSAGSYVFNIGVHDQIPEGTVALNSVQRKVLRVAARDLLEVTPFFPPKVNPLDDLGMVYAEIATITDKGRPAELNADNLIARLLRCFKEQVLGMHQALAFEMEGSNFKIIVNNLLVDVGGESVERSSGFLRENTTFIFTNGGQNPIKIIGQKGYSTTQLFKQKKVNFEELGIGGMDKQFDAIFRRAFASRVFPPSIVQRLGIQHVKGILLFGPPGTGKTLIARQIGKILNGREPKVVNGPEVLSKFVGEAEERVRKLFAEADEEYKAKGDESELHIIIFDEIDAICKQRGSVKDGSGVHDTLVNQLLTKIDGVDSLNNILLIGMTNRKDMLDEALLRPGRLEVQIEIGLPDEAGRLQILKIHTNKMNTNSFLDRDVNLEVLAETSQNFSGAEIEGLVKAATSHALNRNVDFNDLHKALDESEIKVTMEDFVNALEEVRPAFGASLDTLESYRPHGIISCGEAFDHLVTTMKTLVMQVEKSEKTPLLTCLLEGLPGSGKSAMAATAAIESGFFYVKMISPENLIGYSEQSKSSQINKIFEDAYKSPLSLIILDDIERLLEYVAIGPRFSNTILQSLLVLIKKNPPPGRKLLILGTTSQGDVLDSMGLTEVFNVSLNVPALQMDEIVRVVRHLNAFDLQDIPPAVDCLASHAGKRVPLKKLLLWVEMAKQGLEPGAFIPLDQWSQVLRDLS